MPWWSAVTAATLSGATITLGSTVLSCALAIEVEKQAHRALFRIAPHKYATVDYVPYGLTQSQMDDVHRRYPRKQQLKQPKMLPSHESRQLASELNLTGSDEFVLNEAPSSVRSTKMTTAATTAVLVPASDGVDVLRQEVLTSAWMG
jgi:hypothetical protein